MLVVTLVSLWTPYLRVCTEDAGREVCRPLALTGPAIPLLVLVIFCMMWPELKSFKHTGVAEAERRDEVLPPGEDLKPSVPEVKRRADDAVRELEEKAKKGRENG